MKEYTTQMDAARKGLITPQMKKVASKEHIAEEQLRQLVSEGKVVICANKKHICLEPEGIGSMLRTKINVNLGVSRDCKNYDMEMQKKGCSYRLRPTYIRARQALHPTTLNTRRRCAVLLPFAAILP